MVISKKFLHLKQERQLNKLYIFRIDVKIYWRCANKHWNGISMIVQKIHFVRKTHLSKIKDILLGEIKQVYF